MLRCKFRRGMFRLIVLNLLSAMFIPALNRKKTFIRRTDCGCMGPHAWRKTIEWDAEDFAKLLLAVDDISIERFFLLSHVLGRICNCLCRIRSHHVVACHTPCHERPYFVYTFGRGRGPFFNNYIRLGANEYIPVSRWMQTRKRPA